MAAARTAGILPCGRMPAWPPRPVRVPDLGQVPQPDPGVVTFGFVPVVAGIGGDRVDGDDQIRPGPGAREPLGSVSTRRPVLAFGSEGEPVFSRRRSWACAFPMTLGFGPR